jgi:hypothetical protein
VLGFIAYREGRLFDAQRAFEQACALPGHSADAQDNLKAVRAELGAIYRATAGSEPVAEPHAAAQFDFAGTVQDLHRGQWGREIDARLLGAMLGGRMDAELEARLDELPSAAAASERRFLMRFAARFWDGRTDVFENGPLLGGTTRALALGMLANPHRDPAAQLHTYDWFTTRVPLDAPADVWDSLARRGLISHVDAASADSGTFLPIFEVLHSGHDYSSLVHAHVAFLPGSPDDDSFGDPRFEPEEGREFSLVFVDGCKSWYGTRYWLEHLAEQIPTGSHLIFQDYGWYTCFWLPALVSLLWDNFRLVAHVEDTYAFELVRPLTSAQVRNAFLEHPADLGRDRIDDIFLHLGVEAGERSDLRGAMVLAIQHAAALAYIGHKDEAAEYISSLRARPEYARFRQRFLDPALRSPTYTPEGPILL